MHCPYVCVLEATRQLCAIGKKACTVRTCSSFLVYRTYGLLVLVPGCEELDPILLRGGSLYDLALDMVVAIIRTIIIIITVRRKIEIKALQLLQGIS